MIFYSKNSCLLAFSFRMEEEMKRDHFCLAFAPDRRPPAPKLPRPHLFVLYMCGFCQSNAILVSNHMTDVAQPLHSPMQRVDSTADKSRYRNQKKGSVSFSEFRFHFILLRFQRRIAVHSPRVPRIARFRSAVLGRRYAVGAVAPTLNAVLVDNFVRHFLYGHSSHFLSCAFYSSPEQVALFSLSLCFFSKMQIFFTGHLWPENSLVRFDMSTCKGSKNTQIKRKLPRKATTPVYNFMVFSNSQEGWC